MKRALLPSQKRILSNLGKQIKLARLRRDLSAEQIAERADISRGTLIKIENGDEGVAMGHYFRVLIALGLASDILLVAKDDELGRKLQDAKLNIKKRASKKIIQALDAAVEIEDFLPPPAKLVKRKKRRKSLMISDAHGPGYSV